MRAILTWLTALLFGGANVGEGEIGPGVDPSGADRGPGVDPSG